MALTEKEQAMKLQARNQIAVQVLPILLESGLKLNAEMSLQVVVDRAFILGDLVVARIDEGYASMGKPSGLALPK